MASSLSVTSSTRRVEGYQGPGPISVNLGTVGFRAYLFGKRPGKELVSAASSKKAANPLLTRKNHTLEQQRAYCGLVSS